MEVLIQKFEIEFIEYFLPRVSKSLVVFHSEVKKYIPAWFCDKFILRVEIMRFSDWSCLWVFFIESSAEVTQQARVLKVELPQSRKKPVLIHRGVSGNIK